MRGRKRSSGSKTLGIPRTRVPQPQPELGVTMQAVARSMAWSLKRRSDDIDEEFEDFEEDKELDEDFDDELDEDEMDDEDLEDLDDYDDLDDEFDDGDEDGFRPRKGPKREWD
jgi:hypothetical protein